MKKNIFYHEEKPSSAAVGLLFSFY